MLGSINVYSSFVHSIQGNHITKHDRNTLPLTVNFNIVTNSSFKLVTIFTRFSSTKEENLHDNDSTHNQFTSFPNYISSSILIN